ncbi:MAG: hypothetical protein OET18_05305 [Desulfobacterales bacterium]|nr:hypothetical protein [Desulfobacterales bacterium]
MSKKTLEEIFKIIIVSVISIFITYLQVRRELLDSKLDKIEYKEDQKEFLKSYKSDMTELRESQEKYNSLLNEQLKSLQGVVETMRAQDKRFYEILLQQNI